MDVMVVTCVATLALMLSSQAGRPTLGEELQKHGMEAAGVYGADRPIRAYQALNERSWSAIAYYWEDGSGRLPDTLRVRTYDKRAKRWQSAGREDFRVDPPASSRRRPVVREPPSFPVGRADTRPLTKSTARSYDRGLDPAGASGRPADLSAQHGPLRAGSPGSLGLYNPATNRDVPVFPAARLAGKQ